MSGESLPISSSPEISSCVYLTDEKENRPRCRSTSCENERRVGPAAHVLAAKSGVEAWKHTFVMEGHSLLVHEKLLPERGRVLEQLNKSAGGLSE